MRAEAGRPLPDVSQDAPTPSPLCVSHPPAPPRPTNSDTGRAGNESSRGGGGPGIYRRGEIPSAPQPAGQEWAGPLPGPPPQTPPPAAARSPRGRRRAGLGGASSSSRAPSGAGARAVRSPAVRRRSAVPDPAPDPPRTERWPNIPALRRRPLPVSPRPLGRPGAAGKLSPGRGGAWGRGVGLGERRVRPGWRPAAPRRRAAGSRRPGGDPAAPRPRRLAPHPGLPAPARRRRPSARCPRVVGRGSAGPPPCPVPAEFTRLTATTP